MSNAQACPCGSQIELNACCLPLIEGKKQAATAEALLRSRYTAFTRGDVDYIIDTHHTRTKNDLDRSEVETWSRNSEWVGLEILQKEDGQAKDDRGVLVFHAHYRQEGKDQHHYEKSYFEKENGAWRFVDAEGLRREPMHRTEPKVGRNDPCPCGSGKKFKKCCERAA